MKYREVTQAITAKVPGPKATSGREQNRWAVVDGKQVLRVTYPKEHRGDIPTGTLNSIRKQLRLTPEQFAEFVRCRLTGPEYLELLRAMVEAGVLG